MWVVQEVVMPNASKVMFYKGERMIHFTNLRSAVDWKDVPNLTHVQSPWSSYLGYLDGLREFIATKDAGKHLPPQLTKLLVIAMLKDAGNPKDKVLALYGIAKHLGWPLPVPDYSKSVAEIYTEAARAAIQFDQSLDLLGFAHGVRPSEDLPSWVPDFSTMTLGNQSILVSGRYRAAANSVSRFSFSLSGYQLTVSGQFIDTIDARSSTLKWDISKTFLGGDAEPPVQMALEGLATIFEWVDFAQQLPATIHGVPRDQAIAQTIFKGSTRPRDTAVEKQAYEQYAAHAYNRLLALRSSAYGPSADMRAMAELADEVVPFNANTTFVVTGSERVGTAPADVEPGDIVVLMTGKDAPAILRQSGDNFLLVGFAYVHGVMDGRLWDGEGALEQYTLV